MSEFHSGRTAFVASRTVTTEKKASLKKHICHCASQGRETKRQLGDMLFFCWFLLYFAYVCKRYSELFRARKQNVHSKDRPRAGRSMLPGFNLCGRALCSSGAGVLPASGDRGCGRGQGEFLAASVSATGTATSSVLAIQVVVACYVKRISAALNSGEWEAYNMKLLQELWQSLPG